MTNLYIHVYYVSDTVLHPRDATNESWVKDFGHSETNHMISIDE